MWCGSINPTFSNPIVAGVSVIKAEDLTTSFLATRVRPR